MTDVIITIAMQLGNVFNYILKEYSFGWRVSIGVEAVVGGFLALGMFLLPRSPRSHGHSSVHGHYFKSAITPLIGG